MLLACNYFENKEFSENSFFETSKKNHGEELYSQLALRAYSEEFVDLLEDQYNGEEVLAEWLELAKAIIVKDVNFVRSFLEKNKNDQEKTESIKKFICSLDNNSLSLVSSVCNDMFVCIKPYIIETLVESVRKREFEHNPSRFDSYICFSSKADADTFQNVLMEDEYFEVSNDVVLAELDTKLCSVKFEADQSYINNIDEDMTIPETIGMIHNYWNQKKSDTPITEILLQGEVGVVRQL